MKQGERINGWVVTSAALHVAFGLVVIFSPAFFPTSGASSWGSNNGGGDGVNMKIVSNFSGIPLPSPPVVKETAVANESPGLYKSEEAPEPEPVKDAVRIPDPKTVAKKPPAKPAAAAANRAPVEAPPAEPSNAVPYGQGGKPALQYGQFQSGAGTMGVGFGEGSFGERYGAYVQAMTRQISQNWLKSLVEGQGSSAPRVYVRFTIAKDGAVSDVETQQSSGIPSLDNSAIRAIRRSNPLPPLPQDYRGSNVTVSFYFEYTR